MGIHIELAFREPETCQVAPHSTSGERMVTAVTKSSGQDETESIVEEFTVSVPGNPSTDGRISAERDVNKLFDTEGREIYRYRREAPQACVCDVIEASGSPVREVTAVDGTLYVTFVAQNHERLQSVLEELSARYDEMRVCRLFQSNESIGAHQLTFVDIGALTERQQEVLTTAHELGYFEHPRETSVSGVAAELDIAKSTFTEHLAAAQRNLLDELLDE